MSFSRARISLVLNDDIKSLNAVTESPEELLFSVPSYDPLLFDAARSVILNFYDGSGARRCEARVAEARGIRIKFSMVRDLTSAAEERNFNWVDYKGSFNIARVLPEEEPRYAEMAERVNSAEQNGLSKRIRAAIDKDDSDDSEMLSFLMEINFKLDEILSVLKPSGSPEKSVEVTGVSVSGEGTVFYCAESLEKWDKAYISGVLRCASMRLSFASLCSLSRVEDSASGIYRAGFINMDESVRDDVIKFVFAREREILKGARV